MKNIRVFYLNIFQFLEVKFSIYLNRQVFVMLSKDTVIMDNVKHFLSFIAVILNYPNITLVGNYFCKKVCPKPEFYGDKVQIICHFLWNHSAHCGTFANGVMLMYTLEGVSSVANFSTAYEESQ